MLSLYLSMLNSDADKEKFKQLYMDNKNILYNYAYSILHDAKLAEDAVQETFLSLTKRLHKINGWDCNKIRKYLLIIVRNASFTIYNQNKNMTPVEDDVLDTIAEKKYNLERDVELRDLEERVMEMIKSMRSTYGDVLMLKFCYEYSDEEIAETLNITVENVRVRLHRGREKLKKMVKEMLEYDGSAV